MTAHPSTALVPIVPEPGTDLVPDGWADDVVVPWLDVQADDSLLRAAKANLNGLIATYETMKADVFELVKAKCYLELRWGALLGPTTPGSRTDLEPSLANDGLTGNQRHAFRKMAEHKEQVREYLASATDAEQLSRKAVLRYIDMVGTTGSTFKNEWYTPPRIVEAARTVMGAIDLDPASCMKANEIVKATKFFTVADDGLLHPWSGRVWLNPPFQKGLITQFCEKLLDHYEDKDVAQGTVLTNNATETAWFQDLGRYSSCMCFLLGRVQFWHPTKKKGAPLRGQTLFYFGENVEGFEKEFWSLGLVAWT